MEETAANMEFGYKDDLGKPKISLIPRSAIEAEAGVMAYGARKYARDNWKKGMVWSRVIDAALRHLVAIADGEDLDQETGYPHAAHVRACMAFLIEYKTYNLGIDDRTIRNVS